MLIVYPEHSFDTGYPITSAGKKQPPEIGREPELRRLDGLLAEASGKRGSVVLIAGEAGIGKSALVERFLEACAADCQVFRGRCSEQYGRAIAYSPWVEILVDITTDVGPDGRQIASRLLSVVKDSLGPWLGAVPVVGSIVAAIYETGKSVKTHFVDHEARMGRLSTDDFRRSFLATLQKVAESGPEVLFLDDLQWSDASSIDLLFWLTREVANLPVLIIGTYRPSDVNVGSADSAHPLRAALHEMHHRYQEWAVIHLDTLSDEWLKQYLTTRFPRHEFDESFTALLYDVTDGNPFFAEQYLHLLEEQEHIVRCEGKWHLSGDVSAVRDQVPKDVEGVVRKRLDRLQDDIMKTVLLYGSAEGEEFTSFVLSKLLGWDSLSRIDRVSLLTRIKQSLVETHRFVLDEGTIVLPKAKRATKYRFAHTVLHRVLYGELNGEQRVLLHRAIAECLEAEYEGREEDIAEQLAEHFAGCEEWGKAEGYRVVAAVKAGRALAPVETEGHFAAALEYVRRLPESEGKNGLIVDLCIRAAKGINNSDTWHSSQYAIPYCRLGLALLDSLGESTDNLIRRIDLVIQEGRAEASDGLFETSLKLAAPIEHIVKGRILNYWIDTIGGRAHASAVWLPYSAYIAELLAWCEDGMDMAVAWLGIEPVHTNPRDARWEKLDWRSISGFFDRMSEMPGQCMLSRKIGGIETAYRRWKDLTRGFWGPYGSGLYEEYRFYKAPDALVEITHGDRGFWMLEDFLFSPEAHEIKYGFDELIHNIDELAREIVSTFGSTTPLEVRTLVGTAQRSLW